MKFKVVRICNSEANTCIPLEPVRFDLQRTAGKLRELGYSVENKGLMELEIFKRELPGGTILLAIHSSPKARFERLRARGRFDAPKDWREFHERDERELGWGLGSLIAMADHLIVNEGTLEEFKSRCSQCLSSLEGHEVQGC